MVWPVPSWVVAAVASGLTVISLLAVNALAQQTDPSQKKKDDIPDAPSASRPFPGPMPPPSSSQPSNPRPSDSTAPPPNQAPPTESNPASPADASFWPILFAFSRDGSLVWAPALREVIEWKGGPKRFSGAAHIAASVRAKDRNRTPPDSTPSEGRRMGIHGVVERLPQATEVRHDQSQRFRPGARMRPRLLVPPPIAQSRGWISPGCRVRDATVRMICP